MGNSKGGGAASLSCFIQICLLHDMLICNFTQVFYFYFKCIVMRIRKCHIDVCAI